MKAVILVSFVLNSLFKVFVKHLSKQWHTKSLPDNVKDIYDEEEYKKWQSYSKDYDKLNILEFIINTAIMLVLLVFNVYSKIFYAFDVNIYVRYLVLTVAVDIINDVVSVPLNYHSVFVIEEKYGMNKTTKKTFFFDTVKEAVLGLILTYGLLVIVMLFYGKFGNTGLVWITFAIIAFNILLVLLVMPFLKLFNKFVPLDNQELKDKLIDLCRKYNITVKKIVVKDASKRTTKANAFCTGLGKNKTIALDDNLVNNYSTDQIVAVFAHEFAHAKFRHMIKSLPFGLVRIAFTVLFLGLALNITSLFSEFGFDEVNFFFAITVSSLLSWPFELLLDIISNKISRNHEYQADAFAAKEGYGEYLISALKKLCKESLSDINPHPTVVKLKYSHPTLSQRIAAVEQISKQNKQ